MLVKKLLAGSVLILLILTITTLTVFAQTQQVPVVVLFKEKVTDKHVNLVKSNGGVVTRSYNIIDGLAANLPRDRIDDLKNNPLVISVDPDVEVRALDTSADTQIRANQVWAAGNTGQGIPVAILDTGIDNTHPEFSGRIVKCNNEIFRNPNTCNDKNGHGTHVAGIAGATGVDANAKGVAPGISFYIDQVLNNAGSGSLSGIIAGIDRSVANGAKIISMSLGTDPITTTQSNCDATFPSFTAAINNAVAAGVTVVAAAGNSGTSGVGAPGCISSTIAVAAVNSADTIASFSSRGGAVTDHGIAAPGVSIYSSYKSGGYATLSGTSMATPHVAGTIALMIKSNPSLTPATIKSTLFSTACNGSTIPSCPTGAVPNSDYGYGRVDALAAFNAPGPPTGLTASATSSSQIDLSWTAPTGPGTILGYYLKRSETGSFIDPPYISNLLSYWKFDGNDQATTDFGSLANTATLTGTKNLVSGQIHRAFSFDGASYVTVNDEPDYDFERTDTFSFSYWFKTSSTSLQAIITKMTANGDAGILIGSRGTTHPGEPVMRLTNNLITNEINVYYPTNMADGNWHHYVWTYDGSSTAAGVKLYVDGVPVALTVVRNNLSASTLNNVSLTIGAFNGSTSPLNGQLDDVRIYNKELTSSEVSKLYAVTAQTTTSKSDTGLDSGATYYYEVLALNDNREGAVSNTASATTP